MVFVAQFDLAEVHRRAPGCRLPASGLLSFFRAVDDEFGGPRWYDPESEADASLVLYAPDIDDLSTAPIPLHAVCRDERFVAPPCACEFGRARPLPELDALQLSRYEMGDDQWEAYRRLADRCAPDDERSPGRHQLLGYLDDTWEWHGLTAERIAQGLDQFGGFDAHSDFSRALVHSASKWIPLARFASCEATGWMWGDGGSLQWLIRAEDLDQARFDRAVAVSVR